MHTEHDFSSVLIFLYVSTCPAIMAAHVSGTSLPIVVGGIWYRSQQGGDGVRPRQGGDGVRPRQGGDGVRPRQGGDGVRPQ